MHNEQKKPRRAIGRSDVDTIATELLKLTRLSLLELRAAWAHRLQSDAPATRSRELLLRMLAWRIQEKAFGGMDAKTQRTLQNIAEAIDRDGDYQPKIRHNLSLGVILTREWKGVIHKVTVTSCGFQYRDNSYKSLSEIARTITGTRWSGPRFFGLQQKRVPVVRE